MPKDIDIGVLNGAEDKLKYKSLGETSDVKALEKRSTFYFTRGHIKRALLKVVAKA